METKSVMSCLRNNKIWRKCSKEKGEQRSRMSPEVSEDSLPRPYFGAKDYSRAPAGSWPQHSCQQASLNCHVTVFPVTFLFPDTFSIFLKF